MPLGQSSTQASDVILDLLGIGSRCSCTCCDSRRIRLDNDVTTLNPCTITRDQNESVRTQVGILATGWQVHARNLSFIVDIEWFRARYAQVEDRPFVPQHGPKVAGVTVEGLPNDLTFGVDRPRLTEAVTIQSSEIGDYRVFPEGGVERLVTWSSGTADYLACVIDPVCERKVPPRVPKSVRVPWSQRNACSS